jgi:predicted small integral membrane protein
MMDGNLLRGCKCALLAAVALFYTLVVFNNVTDYNSNFQFVQHVLAMDTTFTGNGGLWRALHGRALDTAFYIGIICWECGTMVLCWAATVRLLRRVREPAAFVSAKPLAAAALTLGMLLWFVAFLSVGGEWFLMWQSKVWNGQDAAFRMFACLGLVLLFVMQAETDA